MRAPSARPPARPAAAKPAARIGAGALRAVWATASPPSLTFAAALRATVIRAASVDVAPIALPEDLPDPLGLVAGALDVLRHALGRLRELLARAADRLQDRLRVDGRNVPWD